MCLPIQRASIRKWKIATISNRKSQLLVWGAPIKINGGLGIDCALTSQPLAFNQQLDRNRRKGVIRGVEKTDLCILRHISSIVGDSCFGASQNTYCKHLLTP